MEGNAITLLTEITSILVGGIESIASGIGTGLSTLVNSIFLTTDGDLSTFGTLVVVFAGISLAIGSFVLPLIIVILYANFGKIIKAVKC